MASMDGLVSMYIETAFPTLDASWEVSEYGIYGSANAQTIAPIAVSLKAKINRLRSLCFDRLSFLMFAKNDTFENDTFLNFRKWSKWINTGMISAANPQSISGLTHSISAAKLIAFTKFAYEA